MLTTSTSNQRNESHQVSGHYNRKTILRPDFIQRHGLQRRNAESNTLRLGTKFLDRLINYHTPPFIQEPTQTNTSNTTHCLAYDFSFPKIRRARVPPDGLSV